MNNKIYSEDGWSDLYSGLKNENNTENKVSFSRGGESYLSEDKLEDIFSHNGLANIICTEIPNDALRNGVIINNDDSDALQSKLKSLDYQTEFINAFSSARFGGGSVIVVDITDGSENLKEPVNFDNIDSVNSLELYEASNLLIDDSCFETDVESDSFGKLKYYKITFDDNAQYTIHVDRCLYFDGDFLPRKKRKDNGYIGGSVIKRIYSELTKIGPAFEYTMRLLERFNVLKFSIKGLGEKIANKQEDQIATRLGIMKRGMSIMNAALYDADGENITSESINLNGIPDVLKMLMVNISSVSRIPVNRLFTKLVGGIGDEGDSDENRYYDHVDGERIRVITKPFNKLIKLVGSSKEVNVDPSQVTWDFAPLKTETQKELLEMQKIHAETLQIYVDLGLISGQEARALIIDRNFDLKIDELDYDLAE